MAEKWVSTRGSCFLPNGTFGSIVKPSLSSELSPGKMSVAPRPCAALGFALLDKLSRLRVTAFSPTTTYDAISGEGGTESTKASFPSFVSCLFRFLSLFPFDLTRWLARYCPIGDSVLDKAVRLSGSYCIMQKL